MADNTYGRADCLPPIGDIDPGSAAEGNAVQLIYARRQGIVNALSLPLRLAKKCRKIAMWGEEIETPDESHTVVHKIRQAVETQVSNHLKEPVKITLEPVETGEYAKFYWCGPIDAVQDALAMGIQIDPLFIGAVTPMGQFIPPQPLPAQLVMALKQAAEQQPDIISPDYVCKLDDQYTSKVLQRKLDADWIDAGGEKWLRSRVYANVIEGWQLPFYEWDPKRGHILNRNSIFQTYVAQEVEDIDDAEEAGIDLYLDLNEAIAKYPEQKQAILDSNITTSGQIFPPQTQGQVPTQYIGTFRRPMVTKVVWWVRNQPVGVKLALQMGLVQQQETNGQQNSVPGTDPDNTGAAPDAGGGTEYQPAIGAGGSSGQSTSGSQGGAAGDNIQAGGTTPLSAPDAVSVPPVSVFTLPDGTPVTPDDPHWPTAVHQISIIGRAVVETIVNPWGDMIPIAHMRNTMVIGKPWGVGEPHYAKKLQDAYSNITDSAVRHTEYNANPGMEMHQGLKDAMEAEYGRALVEPGRIIGVPPDLWGDGKLATVRPIIPPPFPESSIEIRSLLGQDFNEIAGRPDVLTGNTPTPNASGELVANLQNAAVEPLNFKAQEIVYCVEKIAKLMMYAILHYEDPSEIADQLSMPLPLLMLVMQRAGKRPPNVQITISTGAGSVLERKHAQVVQWNQMVSPDDGLPLMSGKRARNTLHGDADASFRESVQSRRDASAGMQQQKPPTEAINYADLPPQGQAQMAQQAGIQLSPEDLAAHQQQQQQQKQDEAKAKGFGGDGGP